LDLVEVFEAMNGKLQVQEKQRNRIILVGFKINTQISLPTVHNNIGCE
jgi:hypothetical protein